METTKKRISEDLVAALKAIGLPHRVYGAKEFCEENLEIIGLLIKKFYPEYYDRIKSTSEAVEQSLDIAFEAQE